VLSIAVARLDGRLVRDIVSADGKGFLKGLGLWFALAVPSTYTNTMVRPPWPMLPTLSTTLYCFADTPPPSKTLPPPSHPSHPLHTRSLPLLCPRPTVLPRRAGRRPRGRRPIHHLGHLSLLRRLFPSLVSTPPPSKTHMSQQQPDHVSFRMHLHTAATSSNPRSTSSSSPPSSRVHWACAGRSCSLSTTTSPHASSAPSPLHSAGSPPSRRV
jgi:hypothetical protein